MRIFRRELSGDVGFNMTPMIDVVFQLIIFFLLTSHLARRETQLPLPLPPAASGQTPADPNRPRLTVNVLADGTLLVADQPIAAGNLQELLRERVAVHGKELEVRIRGDKSVPYARVEPVLVASAAAGIWHVAYAVQPDQREP